MKRGLLALLLALALLGGCAPKEPEAPSAPPEEPEEELPVLALPDHEALTRHEANTLRALIVDGAETGVLLLAGEGDAEGVYLLPVWDAVVYLDGKKAEPSALRDGMTVEVVYEGELQGSDPTHINGVDAISAWERGTEQQPGGMLFDLCGLYLRVLDDLWRDATALTYGAAYVSVDLSGAPGGLSAAARRAVAMAFAQTHGLALLPEGTTHGNTAYLTLTAAAGAEGEEYHLPVVKFDASLRRGNKTLRRTDCSAVWPQLGSWQGYSVGAETGS